MRTYNLDTQAAKEANTGGKRITTTGKYPGAIRAAFYEKNDKGTESVKLMFASDSGQECGPLAIYTHNGDGKELAGYKLLNAIMTCAKIKTLSFAKAPVELYDFDSQSMVTKQLPCSPELSGKKIGLVLQQEEYQKGNGSVGERMIIAAPFEASTEKMAMEILSSFNGAEALGNFMSYIAKNPVRKLRNPQASQQSSVQPAPDHDSFDDDIPF